MMNMNMNMNMNVHVNKNVNIVYSVPYSVVRMAWVMPSIESTIGHARSYVGYLKE